MMMFWFCPVSQKSSHTEHHALIVHTIHKQDIVDAQHRHFESPHCTTIESVSYHHLLFSHRSNIHFQTILWEQMFVLSDQQICDIEHKVHAEVDKTLSRNVLHIVIAPFHKDNTFHLGHNDSQCIPPLSHFQYESLHVSHLDFYRSAMVRLYQVEFYRVV